jgi:hypothetical protein
MIVVNNLAKTELLYSDCIGIYVYSKMDVLNLIKFNIIFC